MHQALHLSHQLHMFLLMKLKISIGLLGAINFGHDFFFVFEVPNDKIEKIMSKRNQPSLA